MLRPVSQSHSVEGELHKLFEGNGDGDFTDSLWRTFFTISIIDRHEVWINYLGLFRHSYRLLQSGSYDTSCTCTNFLCDRNVAAAIIFIWNIILNRFWQHNIVFGSITHRPLRFGVNYFESNFLFIGTDFNNFYM